jgi:hypothetical protein
MANKRRRVTLHSAVTGYDVLLADIARVIEEARRAAARSVNVVMTTTYWLVGRRIVEQEQHGATRAAYGEQLLKQLSRDLSKRFGRGFSERNLEQMRIFYLGWPISQTLSAKSLPSTAGPIGAETSQTPSAEFPAGVAGAGRPRFPCRGLTTSGCWRSRAPTRATSMR